jgi:hypothetical protein
MLRDLFEVYNYAQSKEMTLLVIIWSTVLKL